MQTSAWYRCQVPHGIAETDVAAASFKNFSELEQGSVRALMGDQALKAQEEVNKKRSIRDFEKGGIVFRHMQTVARSPKHMHGKPSRGPYIVVDQRSLSGAVLLGPVAT